MDLESDILTELGTDDVSAEFLAAIGADDNRSIKEILFGPKRPRQKYNLSPQGLAKLRATIAKNKPWRLARGPTTLDGKLIVRHNRMKHGLCSQSVSKDERRRFEQLMQNLSRQEQRLGRPLDPKIRAQRDQYAVRLGYARTVTQLSMAALARRLGVSEQTIQHAERGQVTVTAKTQEKIARGLAAMGIEI
jgi:DNA-binding XRE family transcriptional regulator